MNGSPPDSAGGIQAALEHRIRVEEFQRRHRIALLTLLFTDIVGSTQLKQSLGDREGLALLAKHDTLVRDILGQFGEAEEISTAGDSFFIVFAKPSDAVKFSLLLQAGLRASFSEARALLRDRIGIHVGEVFVEAQPGSSKARDIFGIQVDVCARLMSLAEGGQVLVSRSCLDTAREVFKGETTPGLGELSWVRHGLYALKGLEEPMEVCEVGEAGLAPLRPPPDTEKAYRKLAPIFTGQAGLQAARELGPASQEDQRGLVLLRDRVKQFWVDEVLEKSLVGTPRLDLGKRAMPGAVEHPWEMVLELPDHTSRSLPTDKPIEEVFEEVGRSVLVLGEPGAGKTISLLELARALVLRHQGDPAQPIPVVLNLSTWTQKGGGFLGWLVEELKTKYYVPARLSRRWLSDNRLVLLLDGLDEVPAAQRAGCVGAVNGFLQEYGVPGLAICSRVGEYSALPLRLRLNGAVCLQPLTPEQVDSHLARGGPKLAALRQALGSDPVLRELAASPLMLSIMSVAYQDAAADVLAPEGLDTVEARRSHLLDAYIERMFERRGKAGSRYTKEQTKEALAWLAQRMRQHSQSVFLLEQMQPSWLSSPGQLALYTQSSRLLVGLLLGAVAAVCWNIQAFYFGTYQVERHANILGFVFGFCWQLLGKFAWKLFGGVAGGLVLAVGLMQSRTLAAEPALVFPVMGVLAGQLAACLDVLRFKGSLVATHESAVSTPRRSPILNSVYGFGIGFGACTLALIGLHAWNWEAFFSTFWGLTMGLAWGLLFRIRGASRATAEDIQVVEALRWSKRDALRNGAYWSLGGIGIAVICLLSDSILTAIFSGVYAGPIDCLVIAELFCLSGWTFGILFGGLLSDLIRTRTRPNQGIRLSLRNAAIGLTSIGLASLLVGACWLWLPKIAYARFYMTSDLPVYVAFLLAPVAALWYGGLDVLRHWTLRLILAVKRHTLFNYVRFLDFAANLAFLQKVGGGYIFIHRMLLEHFANLRGVPKAAPSTYSCWPFVKVAVPAFAVCLALGLGTAGGLGYARRAAVARQLAKHIPPRDPRANPQLIDLSRYYNEPLRTYSTRRLDAAIVLPPSIRKLGEVPFDVRGVVQLRSQDLWSARYPERIVGIKLGLKCQRLHFLHYPGQGSSPRDLTSAYTLHYDNGERREIPIRPDKDSGERCFCSLTRSNLVVLRNDLDYLQIRGDRGMFLYRMTWQNPLPKVVIKSVDYESKMPPFALGLVAITAE